MHLEKVTEICIIKKIARRGKIEGGDKGFSFSPLSFFSSKSRPRHGRSNYSACEFTGGAAWMTRYTCDTKCPVHMVSGSGLEGSGVWSRSGPGVQFPFFFAIYRMVNPNIDPCLNPHPTTKPILNPKVPTSTLMLPYYLFPGPINV